MRLALNRRFNALIKINVNGNAYFSLSFSKYNMNFVWGSGDCHRNANRFLDSSRECTRNGINSDLNGAKRLHIERCVENKNELEKKAIQAWKKDAYFNWQHSRIFDGVLHQQHQQLPLNRDSNNNNDNCCELKIFHRLFHSENKI